MRILTFDIEDWYCHDCESGDKNWINKEVRIYEGVDKILDSLAERNQKATFFVLGWLAEITRRQFVRLPRRVIRWVAIPISTNF